jgi:DNA-directed RNA polymerase subunit RPC12/RpoP
MVHISHQNHHYFIKDSGVQCDKCGYQILDYLLSKNINELTFPVVCPECGEIIELSAVFKRSAHLGKIVGEFPPEEREAG